MGKKVKKVLTSNKGDEGGTPELRAMIKAVGGFHIGHDNETNRAVTVNRIQIPLDFYASRDSITERQYAAGMEFYRLWYYGAEKCGHIKAFDLAEPQHGMRDFESRVMLEEKYNKAKKAIRGLIAALVCYNVCCMGEWAFGYLPSEKARKNVRYRARALELLRGGLDDLADYFKFPL